MNRVRFSDSSLIVLKDVFPSFDHYRTRSQRMTVNSRTSVSLLSLTTLLRALGAMLKEDFRFVSSSWSTRLVLCVCIHFAMRCLSPRLRYPTNLRLADRTNTVQLRGAHPLIHRAHPETGRRSCLHSQTCDGNDLGPLDHRTETICSNGVYRYMFQVERSCSSKAQPG